MRDGVCGKFAQILLAISVELHTEIFMIIRAQAKMFASIFLGGVLSYIGMRISARECMTMCNIFAVYK